MSKASRNGTWKIGVIESGIVNRLGLSIEPNSEILFGETNLLHIQTRHPNDYINHGDKMAEILNNPDYVSVNPRDDSIRYIKKYDENVLVAVRLTLNKQVFVRSLFVITDSKIEHYKKSTNFLDLTSP